ncbi:MAG TPA: hypothetical protein VM053_07230 [Gemmatimonadaceae bacterium]|nr:hypothetical protein [Gemmatimonadaceae bacterium]
MKLSSSSALVARMTLSAVLLSCTDIPTGNDKVLSFTVNPLPAPSVVVGDQLRDSLGVVRPITITAFDFQGDTAVPPQIRFFAGGRGIKVDSITGVVTGDSVQAAARIIITVGSIQAPVTLGVALRPDTMIASNGRDSLSYSLTDTTQNVSNAIGVRLLHGTTTDSAVAGWRVSFRIASPSGTIAQLVNDQNATGTTADTTDVTGVASRRVKLAVAQLTAATDSVVVFASASYRGVAIHGSPVRLVLKYKPK